MSVPHAIHDYGSAEYEKHSKVRPPSRPEFDTYRQLPIVLILLPLPTSATEKLQSTHTILTIYELLEPPFFSTSTQKETL